MDSHVLEFRPRGIHRSCLHFFLVSHKCKACMLFIFIRRKSLNVISFHNEYFEIRCGTPYPHILCDVRTHLVHTCSAIPITHCYLIYAIWHEWWLERYMDSLTVHDRNKGWQQKLLFKASSIQPDSYYTSTFGARTCMGPICNRLAAEQSCPSTWNSAALLCLRIFVSMTYL